MADDMQKRLSREKDMVKARHAAEVADVDAKHRSLQDFPREHLLQQLFYEPLLLAASKYHEKKQATTQRQR